MAAGVDLGDGSYSVDEEIELLEAIYIHELTVDGPRERPSAVSILLHPSTGDEEHKRFVCLTLVISLPQQYPFELPSTHIKTPRGLSEAHINSILTNLRELAESCLGRPMLYELIEYAKESLTDNNVPSCTCAICLCHFQDSHEFTKTECYHYFHCGCLATYIEFSLQQESTNEDKTKVDCPMCRLPITYNLVELQTVASIEAKEDEFVYKPSEEIKKLQRKMASLFEKQKRKGGVIDVEQERNKFLIDITTVRQEETKPESEPTTGPEADTTKTNRVEETQANNAPKRPDVAKEIKRRNSPVRSEKWERKERKEFTKNSRTSRGTRRLDCEPTTGPEADIVKTSTVERTPENNVPKWPDVAKENREQNNPVRSDKPERKAKTSRSSRGRRRPFDKTESKPEEGKFKHDEQRGTEEKGLSGDDGPKCSEKKVLEKIDLNESDEQKNRFSLYVEANQANDQTELGDIKVSVEGVSEKVLRNDCGGTSDGNSRPSSNGERPRSAKKGRGKAGRGRRSDERKSDLEDGGKGSNKNASSSSSKARPTDGVKPSRQKSGGNNSSNNVNSAEVTEKTTSKAQSTEGAKTSYKENGGSDWGANTTSTENFVKQTSDTQPSEAVKSSLQKKDHSQDQATSVKEISSTKGASRSNKGKTCMPPPGFESMVVGKGGSGQSINDFQLPPPGFEKRPSRPKPPAGFSEPIERTESSTSPHVPS